MAQTATTETVYEYISGYCKVHNDHRIIECTFSQYPDGSKELDFMDCDFEKCTHNSECLLARQALEMEQ